MYAAGRSKTHEVELLASLLSVAVSVNDFLVLEDRTVLACAVDLYEVLINDATSTDVEVAYLRVTHLSCGQTYVFAAGEEL